MLKILQRRLPVVLRPEEAYQVQQNLQARFNSLLAGVRLEYLRRLGLSAEPMGLSGPPENSSLTAGELFMPEPGTIFYVKYNRQGEGMEAGAISRSRENDFSHFFSEVKEAVLEVHGSAGDWQQMGGSGELNVEEARPADINVSQKELEASRELMNERSKSLLELLSRSESMLFKQLEEHNRKDATALLSTLEELDLVRKDFAVLDPESGQQILRVASRETIEEYSQKGFNWFVSGKSVNDMEVDEVLSCTPFCRGLLENDQWLLVILLGALKTLGFANEDVQVCQQPNAPIQLFLSLNHQNFLVILTNDKLTLDDSYLISAQVAAYGLQHVLVISNQKISKLMKHHLIQTNADVSFNFIDSLNDLEETVQTVFLEKQRGYLKDVLGPISDMTPVKIEELVIQKMAPRTETEPAAQEVVPPAATGFDMFGTHEPEPAPRTPAPAPTPEPPQEFMEDFSPEAVPEIPGFANEDAHAEAEPEGEGDAGEFEVATFFEDLMQPAEEAPGEEGAFEEEAFEEQPYDEEATAVEMHPVAQAPLRLPQGPAPSRIPGSAAPQRPPGAAPSMTRPPGSAPAPGGMPPGMPPRRPS